MSLKPILFNTQMVRALLEGRKTVTRRVVKPQPVLDGHLWKLGGAAWSDNVLSVPVMLGHSLYNRAPYQPDDVLWVRETWAKNPFGEGYIYPTEVAGAGQKWRPSIYMPRKAARIFLRVTSVWVERLQSIMPEDVRKEGINPRWYGGGCKCSSYAEGCMNQPCPNRDNYEYWCHIDPFLKTWDRTLQAKDRAAFGWDANPWVWVIEFEQVEKPAKNDLDGENP